MEFQLLAGLGVLVDGVDVTPSRPQQRTLLACLLLHAGAVVAVDDLVEALWGERPPDTAQTALYGHISMLRRRLGAERIETRPSGYLLRLEDSDQFDLRRFEQLVVEAPSEDPAARSASLRAAIALMPGEPLAEFRFEPFAALEAARLAELRVTALERRIEADLDLGRHQAVIPELQQLVADHPHREGLRSKLMLALYRSGRQADALQVAEEARRFLAVELGVDPGPALQRLEQQVLSHDPRLLAPEPVSPVPESPPPPKPTGIVTFMDAALEPLAPALGPREDPAGAAFEAHRQMVRTVTSRLGWEIDAHGSAIRIAFARARDAAASAVAVQRASRVTGSRVRIGIHSAEVIATDDGYTGPGVGLATHICRAAHPGQVLLSQETRDLLQEATLDEANVRDLGEHRLTDLGRGRRLFQLAAGGQPGEFPPVRDLESRPTNLPVQPSPVIGRALEIRQLTELLTQPGVQLVTLVGPGGTGKTRLAVHAGADLLDGFPDGVFFVNLAPVQDPDLALPMIARTLEVHEAAGETIADTLARDLRNRRLLLVLDNLEHLLAATPAIAALLAGAPGLKVLVTSRSPLRLSAERTYPVAPLGIPEVSDGVDRLIAADSVALFASRGRAVQPEFAITPGNAEAVAGICRLVDGLPLAIELAAARIGVLPPASLLARIGQHRELLATKAGDVPERHRTLEAAIAWSYDLLGADQQVLFRRLGVFSGGCTLEAAETICGDDIDVIDGLTALVDASLIRLEGTDVTPRFVMLETLRDYAARRLDETGEAEDLRRRHALHYTALAERAEPHLRGSPGEWPHQLDLDHDNLRVALDRLEAAGAHEEALRLAGSLWRFWYLTGYLAEGRRRLEAALRQEDRPTAQRGKALIGAAVMAVNAGDFTTAKLRSEEGVELHRTLADAWGRTYSEFMLGAACGGAGDLAGAKRLYEASVRTFRELGDEHSALLVSRNLASTYLELGDRSRAQALLEDNLRRARSTKNERIEASTLGALASIAFDAGRVQDSGWMLKESLRIHRQLGDRLDTAVDLCRAARSLAFAGKAGVAVRLISSFGGMRDQVGHRQSWVAEMNEQTLATARRQLGETAFAESRRRGQGLTIGDAVNAALEALD
jgi:predicted ATPase/DNA-binding SARP family transcriptional activator